ncbi:hypothetical protein Dsin_007589 [Dipteronia sinensis]|uniref:ABC transporter domain-containing protein n=1 Tax=Dipteronia sinensis TaxID=43782 RepID=A0AAE0B1Q0_9ROSI|nr:hypothetical protein Dsin_007589 [Dipteronia sinensis]
MADQIENRLRDLEHQEIDLIYGSGVNSPTYNPFVLSFTNLSYSVKTGPKLMKLPFFTKDKFEIETKTETKLLLDNISGGARQGEITAVLGASGSGHRDVSGGERRRVSIGVDIIHDPILLFLDEPTSGLDSTSSFAVVKVLQRIAKSGSIVIVGKPTCLLQFFIDFDHPVPENENPTEFALDLIRELDETPGGITNLVEFNKSWQGMKNDHKPSVVPLKDAI